MDGLGCYSWTPDCSVPVAACPLLATAQPAQCPVPWWFWITAGVIAAASLAHGGSR